VFYVRRAAAGAPQAVEAKENVRIQDETVTLASISYQNFFRSYPVRPRRAPAGAPARPLRRGAAHYRRVFSPSCRSTRCQRTGHEVRARRGHSARPLGRARRRVRVVGRHRRPQPAQRGQAAAAGGRVVAQAVRGQRRAREQPELR